MLVKCPECELQVSDKALLCPHCGYPLKSGSSVRKRRTRKRRRLPNGFGQISEIRNRNLRKPFRAMVTVGKDENGRPVCKPLRPESYFATYNDAYEALVEYNKNPYDLSPSITVKELFERWAPVYEKTLKGENSFANAKAAWAYCSTVYNMRVVDLRPRHIKGCMDDGVAVVRGTERTPSATMKNKIKSLFNLMLDYAVEYELVDKNYSRAFKLSDEVVDEIHQTKNGHIAFTDEEIEALWANLGKVPYVDLVLFQCYAGWRPQELGLIRLDDVDLDNWLIVGGIKTPSGIDRTVPIHTKIRPIVEVKYKEAQALGSEYLINWLEKTKKPDDHFMSYGRYNKAFTKVMTALGFDRPHRPHDGRTHFVTMAKKNKVDEYAIKYIVGHKISDITEKVYTKREVSWLQDEIEKIK